MSKYILSLSFVLLLIGCGEQTLPEKLAGNWQLVNFAAPEETLERLGKNEMQLTVDKNGEVVLLNIYETDGNQKYKRMKGMIEGTYLLIDDEDEAAKVSYDGEQLTIYIDSGNVKLFFKRVKL